MKREISCTSTQFNDLNRLILKNEQQTNENHQIRNESQGAENIIIPS